MHSQSTMQSSRPLLMPSPVGGRTLWAASPKRQTNSPSLSLFTFTTAPRNVRRVKYFAISSSSWKRDAIIGAF